MQKKQTLREKVEKTEKEKKREGVCGRERD